MLLDRYDNLTNRKAWQAFLVTQGFQLKVDGDLGVKSSAATMAFQTKHGLPASDLVNDATIELAKRQGFAGFEIAGPTPPVPSQSPRLILISAGHTNVEGQDQGVAGNGYIEGKAAVVVRDHVAAALRERGLTVIKDGADGVNDPLKKAIALARTAKIAIEFHFNAGPLGANGVEVLSKPKLKPLAQSLARAVASAAGLNLRGAASGWKADDSGAHHRLGFCEAGGLIVELCFMSNGSDMAAYEANFEAVVKAIADVIAGA